MEKHTVGSTQGPPSEATAHGEYLTAPRDRSQARSRWTTSFSSGPRGRQTGRPRSSRRAPQLTRALGGQPPSASSADRSSPATQRSSSAESLERICSTASAEPIFPSAQIACPRTSGASSASTGTRDAASIGDPVLPSATAALRLEAHQRRPRHRRVAERCSIGCVVHGEQRARSTADQAR